MFESLLESVLGSFLNKYLEGFKKENLQLSVWSGKVSLENLNLRNDIFKQFKLPLELVFGKLGKLKITVPWTSLGSNPVDVLIEDILIVVRPITDQSSWELSDSSQNFELKEAALNAVTLAIYQELIKTKEEIAKEAGMMKSLTTKIIDNLQVTINNVHVRIENEDLEDDKATFSLGVTLKQLLFNTTDQKWQKQFVDRNLPQNQDLPLYKLLKIDNFAMYYKTCERNLIGKLPIDQQMSKFIEMASKTCANGKILAYENDYLLEPIQLEVKLEQFDPTQALAKVKSALTLNIQLQSVGICLQKAQYDNLQRLIELTNDYMCFCNTEALKQKKLDLKAMNEGLIAENRCDGVVTKRQVKLTFIKIYKTQLDIVIKITLDEKKKVELQKALATDLVRQKSTDIYSKIVSAIDPSDLNAWSKQVATDLSETYKLERTKKDQAKAGASWGSYLWGSSSAPAPNTKAPDAKTEQQTKQAKQIQDSLLKKFELEVEQQLQTQELMVTEHAATMKSVPKLRLNFVLNQFTLTMMNDETAGLQTYSNGFQVQLQMFDGTNKYSRHTMEVELQLERFGVDVLQRKDRIPFLQQLTTDETALKLSLALGNIHHQQSDLPPEQIDRTDLDLKLRLRPVEIVYQANPVDAISKFFRVKNMKDYSKIAAQEQFGALASQVNSISKSLEAELKNNKISIKVDAPCVVIPFKQDSQLEIEGSECWVFRMGDLDFYTAENDTKIADLRFHEVYQLKVQRVKFEYVSQYAMWKGQKAETVSVLNDFNQSVVIIKKRDVDQMRNQEMRDTFALLKTPALEVRATFDTNILLSLKPEIFIKLCMIGDLLATEAPPDQYYIDRMNDKFNSAHLMTLMKKENYLMQWTQGTGCLLKPGSLFFYEEGNLTSEFEFYLDGIEAKPENCIVEGQELKLTNSSHYQCKLQFPTMKVAQRWHTELLYSAKEIQMIKRSINIEESQVTDLYESEEEHLESSEVVDTEPTEKDEVNFIFTFESPQIELQLITETKTNTTKALQDTWRLLTYLQSLSVKVIQSTYEKVTDVRINSLRVTDNSGDERFACIFENEPVEGQQELVSIVQRQMSRDSPKYDKHKVDSKLTIGFGGLIVNWKPQCVIHLVQFLNTQSNVVKEQKKPTQQQPNINQLVAESEQGRDKAVSIDTRQLKNCKEKKETLLKVNLKLSFMRAQFIHPQNHTYPIFSLKLEGLQLGYNKKYDHDSIMMQIKNFQIYDNLQYPKTLSPFEQYSKEHPLVMTEIMGVNTKQGQVDAMMLDLEMVMFTYPGQTGCCPEQPSKEYNMKMKVEMSQLRLVYMQEQTMRMIDYIFHQVMALIQSNTKDAPPPQSESFIEFEGQSSRQVRQRVIDWESFNLDQTMQGPSIVINIHSPVIIIPNLRNEKNFFMIDLGKIIVNSSIENQAGRWLNYPKKQIYTTKYLVQMRDMKFDYHSGDSPVDTIWNEDTLDIVVTMVNPSEHLKEPLIDLRASQRLRLDKVQFDLNQVDISMKVEMELKVFQVKLEQVTLIALFDILANNVSFNDVHSKHFKQSLVTQADAQVKVKAAPKTTDHRKSMEIVIVSSCLSMEMRDFDSELIVEICIVGFEYSQVSYLSGASVMSVYAGTMFMFHDEIEQSNMKQVMMGHKDAMAEVFTNEDFYEQMPEEFMKKIESDKDTANFKYVQEYTASGDSEMYIELCQVKMYLRQYVFTKMSEFLIRGLERMQKPEVDVEVPAELKEEKLPSQATSKMTIKIIDTLMLMENLEVGKRCIALQMSLDVVMKSMDPKQLRQVLQPNKTQVWSLTKVDVYQLAAHFCDVDEVSEYGYQMAEKRDILQPLEAHLHWEISLKNDFPVRMVNTSSMTVDMDDAVLKLSIDDLYTVKAISDKQNADLAALSKVWADNGAKTKPKEEPPKPVMKDQSKDKEISSIFFNAKKVEILLINENDGAYVPLFHFNLDSIMFTAQSDSDTQTSGQYIELNIALNYFNPNSGCYEPVIEQFPLMYKTLQMGKNSDVKIQLVEALCMNVTVDLATNIAVFNRLWAQSTETALKFKKKQDEQLISSQPTMQKSKSQFEKRSTTLLKSKSMKSNKFKTQFTSKISHMTAVHQLTIREQIQKLASPYAIRNMTMQQIKVFSIDKMGNLEFAEAEDVQPYEVKKLVQTQAQRQKRENEKKEGFTSNAEMDLFIKLQFESPDMRPVQRLNLNKNNSMTYYNVFQLEDREPLVLQSILEDNRRVLTVRSMFVLRNQTKLQYHVRIFYVDTATDKVVVVLDKRLSPDESMPLPDHINPDLRQKIKIAIRPSKCKKWSQEFKLQKMKTAIKPEVNVVWQHNETYSILRKLPTTLPGCFDLVLQPAVIIKSCLPCRLTVNLTGKNQQPQSSGAQDQADIIQLQQVVLEKQEEIQLLEVKKFNGDLVLTLDLGESFKTSEVALLPDQAKEGDFPIKMFDKQGHQFQIMARVDTKKAGLWIVFYCENLLICRTSQQLAFYYNKKAHGEFPAPIINLPGEKVMYIFENTKEIYAMMSANQNTEFSNKIQLSEAGNIGDFSVASRETKKHYNFAYSSAQWSVSETEFISTKIVEVTPQFILVNQTDQEIIFSQDLKTPSPQTNIAAQSRQIFHWDDKTSQLLKFKPSQDIYNFSPAFTLKDVGTLFVCCQQANEANMYFRVTKRMVNQSVFCVIEESKHAPYTIRNNLSNISLKATQAGDQPLQKYQISPESECPFSWSVFDQNADFQLTVEFARGDIQLIPDTEQKGIVQLLNQQQQTYLKFSLDDLNEQRTVQLQVNQNHSLKIYVSTYRDTNFKVIEFSDEPSTKINQDKRSDSMSNIITEEETKEQKSKKKSGHIFDGKDKAEMTLEIAQINISCITRGVEVFTIFLHDLQVKQATSDTDQVLESYLGRFQIDNNQELDTLYPVMMKPKCLEGQMEHDHLTMQGVDPVFQFYVHTKLNISNVTYYDLVEWLIKELEVKMELDHIYGIMEWVFAFQAQMNTSLTSISPFYKAAVESEEGETQEFQIKSWRDEEIVKTDENTVYIKSYKGSPLCLELSLFKQTQVDNEEETKTQQTTTTTTISSKIGSNMTNMGIKLTSLNNAPIKLDALEITNVYGSQTDISNQLTAHYYGNIKVNIVRVLASSDLIGNPYNVVNSLGTGVKKFYYEPRNGFMEGPLQGGLGIIKGTAGMVGIVGASGLGSIGKVTNSLNKGILAVSLDKDYIHKKEINDIKHKPTGVLSGVGEGVKGFGTSLFSGVTGVITKPIEGASKGGVTGFFKGTGMGLLGLAIKPVTGVIDLVSKTTQGIETSATGTPNCPQNCQRMRQPRPFYRDQNIVKNYNLVHAEVYNHLRAKLKLSQSFLGAYKCGAGQTDTKDSEIELGTEVLVLTSDTLYAMAPDLSIVLQIPIGEITSTVFENSLESQPKMVLKFTAVGLNKKGKPKSSGKRVGNEREFAFTSLEQYEECRDLVIEIQQTLKKLDQ